jgi:4-hydroxyphenylpyruvate dioxygenase
VKTSIATVSIAGSLAEKITAIARAGFDGLEIFENDLVASPMSISEIRNSISDQGLTIDLYQPFRDFEGVSAERLTKNLERARQKFETMNQLGVDTILVCSNVATATESNDELFVEQLLQLAELAAEHDVRVAYEALAWGKYVSTYDHSWRIVQQVNHKNLGLCLDSFHILSRGTQLDTIANIPGEKIFYLQLADAPIMSLDVLSWSRHHRLFPGEGGWDVADFVARVLQAGYQGPLSLEIFNDVYRQGSPSNTARDGHRSLTYLQEQLGLMDLPKLQSPSSFDFVEFAAGEGQELQKSLAALGFIEHGRHARKPATLWSAGDARVIINESKVADSSELTTIGLHYQSGRDVTARMSALQYQVVTRDREGNEAEFGLVNAPNGVEFQISYANELDWIDDFGAGGDVENRSAITGIDHVAIRESWQTADESSLFFRSALGLTLQGELDLPSEYGLVRSRSANNSERSVRIAINVNPAQTQVAQAANHVAFTSSDIFKTAEFVKASKLKTMRVPENYYLDLKHRTGLDDAFVQQLADIHALYDTDAFGSFIHFYTGQLGKVFFEVIQRINGYDGYGAYNSFVRLSSLRSNAQQKALND